uniref:Uncharacterized protein n=1 Tax=Medicago truncatula TaxID=3880 RepID=A2Q3X7_MEDTR|nr:hypothetical protein MtrDRAFT_AC155890g29v2 [Medicago truncatula]
MVYGARTPLGLDMSRCPTAYDTRTTCVKQVQWSRGWC